jgi:hypothetical protein
MAAGFGGAREAGERWAQILRPWSSCLPDGVPKFVGIYRPIGEFQVAALEIEPRFVDVAIHRWQAFTRRDARHAESGLSFDEIAADSSGSGRSASRNDEAKE